MHSQLIGILAIFLYLASSLLFAVRLARHDLAGSVSRNTALILGLLATLLHGTAMYPVLVTPNGLNLGFFNAASLVGWLTALLLLTSSLRQPLENIGIALLPTAALSIALMFAYPSQHVLSEGSHWQLDLHILLSILAYSLLVIAVLQAMLLAMQDHQLRNRHPGGLIRALPPLQTMETLLIQLISTGFILLSLALLTGLLFLEDIFAQHLVHKTVLSLVAWGVFATLLWGHWRFGWRGRTVTRWTLGGFLFLMLAYFGTKLVLELLLGV
ncbi:MAG: inner membrane protein YpjD [Gammaproteobacteria bacterium]